jgi:hypothetical protein
MIHRHMARRVLKKLIYFKQTKKKISIPRFKKKTKNMLQIEMDVCFKQSLKTLFL